MTTVDPFEQMLINAGALTPRATNGATPSTMPPAAPGDPGVARYVEAAVDRECGNVTDAAEGTRNHTLNTAAFNLGQLVGGRHLDRGCALQRLTDAARTAGLPDREIDATVPRALDDGARNPRTITPNPNGDHANGDTTFTLDVDADAESMFLPGDVFIHDQPTNTPALWGDGDKVLWAEGEALMIVGPQGVGKTTLVGNVVKGLLGLEPAVLGLPVRPCKRVLYLAMDRPKQIARAMRRQLGDADRAVLREKLIIWPGPPPVDLARNPDILLRLAEEAEADVVIVDSLKDAAIGLSEDEVGAGYNRARQRLLQSQRDICELHHNRKPNGDRHEISLADVYGSTWLTSGAGSVILLNGEPGDPLVRLKHLKQPADEVGPFRLLHDQGNGQMSIDAEVDLVALAVLTGSEGLTASAAAVALEETDKPTRGQVEKARRRLERLERDGKLKCFSSGIGRGNNIRWFTH